MCKVIVMLILLTLQSLSSTKFRYNYDLPKSIRIPLAIHIDHVLYKQLKINNSKTQILKLTKDIVDKAQYLFKKRNLYLNLQLDIHNIKIIKRHNNILNGEENASVYLNNFCDWQTLRKNRTRQIYYSVLFTGLDLYSVKSNGEKLLECTGRSFGSSICTLHKSCAVIEWKYKKTAFLLAHELAHSLGISHDGPVHNNVCKSRGYIMGAKYKKSTHPELWSECSKQYLIKFLRSRRGWCLNNKYS